MKDEKIKNKNKIKMKKEPNTVFFGNFIDICLYFIIKNKLHTNLNKQNPIITQTYYNTVIL